jgi:hypothetical protein
LHSSSTPVRRFCSRTRSYFVCLLLPQLARWASRWWLQVEDQELQQGESKGMVVMPRKISRAFPRLCCRHPFCGRSVHQGEARTKCSDGRSRPTVSGASLRPDHRFPDGYTTDSSRVERSVLIFLELERPSRVNIPALLVLPEVALKSEETVVKICPCRG